MVYGSGVEQMKCWGIFFIVGFIIYTIILLLLLLLYIYIYIVGDRMGMTVVGDDLIDGLQYILYGPVDKDF